METYLVSNLLENKPDIVDYVFVYYLLGLWDKEEKNMEKEVEEWFEDGQKENFDLELRYTEENLNKLGIKLDHPIEIEYERLKSKRAKKLLKKHTRKLGKAVKNSILNTLNTGNIVELENLLKKNKLQTNIVSKIMRIYRTENTEMRAKVKVEIQEELAKLGIKVKRRWLHTIYNPLTTPPPNYTPREDHIQMNGQIEDDSGYFYSIEGHPTRGPGMFGLPEEDINCRCDVDYILADDI